MDEVVERDAKLFEAGSYEDKGVEVTEEDLDRIAESYRPVPIKVEHTDSPLSLGTLVKVWRAGRDLLGRLAFTKPAWELVKSSGARKLSVALKKDKSGIVEVSLVRNPRVVDAAVFSGEDVICFTADCDTLGVLTAEDAEGAEDSGNSGLTNAESEMHHGGHGEHRGTQSGEESLMDQEQKGDESMEFAEQAAEKDKRIEELETALRAKDVEVKIDELKRAGKLAPAAEKFAGSILMASPSQTVTFDDKERPVADLFLEFLNAQPKVVEFSELAKASGAEDADLAPEARALYEKLGLTPEAVARYRSR